MQIIVNDRQSLLDIAVLALGSVAGVFALAERNALSPTATLSDGQALDYELEDVVNPAVRSAYALGRIAPATDIDRAEYLELLWATGTKKTVIVRPPVIVEGPGAILVDKIDQVIGDLANDRPVKVQSTQHLTRIFADPFSEVFS